MFGKISIAFAFLESSAANGFVAVSLCKAWSASVFRSSGMTPTIFNFYDPRFGLKGEFLDVLISRKTSAAHLLAGPGDHQVGAEIP